MKNKTKETKKVVKEGDKNQPFEEKPKGVEVVKEEREKDFMGDVESDTPNVAKGKEQEDGNAFEEKITTKKETLANKTSIKEEFDITELDTQSVGSALENAEDDDEVITMDEIENEISQMNNLGEELSDMGGLPRPKLGGQRGKATGNNGDAFSQLVSMRNQIDEIINNMSQTPPAVGEAYELNDDNDDNDDVASSFPDEIQMDESEEITDADVEAILGAPATEETEEPVEESLTQTLANQKKVGGGTIPSKEYKSPQTVSRMRVGVQENKKKISGLIKENKDLTKKLNETKKYKQSVTTLVEQYKTALEKYRNQLKEMAIFNTNLAHVNNLLVNESLALTQEDKIRIINEFKKVDTIAESQKKYKAFLTEMKESRKTLTESIEGKVTASVAPSSKQKLEEAKEVTAYANDAHINRMKKLIEYVEKRGSKKII